MKTNEYLILKRKLLSSNFTIFFLVFSIFFLLNFAKNAYYQKVVVIDDIPIILEWNLLNNVSAFHKTHECPEKCFYTSDKKFEPYADTLTVHFGDPNLHVLPTTQNPERINVFMNHKSPLNNNNNLYKKVQKDFFNITATYRLDSDVVMLYDFLDILTESSEMLDQEEVKDIIDGKNKAILNFFNPYNTLFKKDAIIEELKRHTNVTQCNTIDAIKEIDCNAEEIRSHYFTLAFENSDCIDYVTEKVYRLRELIVPIILNRKILRGVHERLNPYVIALSDFSSVQDLANYLIFLMNDKKEYSKYFEWTKIYKKKQTKPLSKNFGCELCKIAWKQKAGFRKVILDISQWWNKDKCFYDIYKDNTY